MRIKLNKRESPKIGDTKTVKRFLFFPLWIGNEIRWLEKAQVVKKYQSWSVSDYNHGCIDVKGWRNFGWVAD